MTTLCCPPRADLLSVGKLAELLQASPRRIEEAAHGAGIIPSLRLNGVLYFCDADVQAIREKLNVVPHGA